MVNLFRKLFKDKLIGNNIFLILFLFIFLLITLYEQVNSISIQYYEGTIENIQALVLASIILITFLKRNIIRNSFGKKVLIFRFIFFGFILFEEMSFISRNLCQVCDSFNTQGEINIHNMPFFVNTVLTKLPLIDELYLFTVIMFLIILILSWGSYIPLIKRVKGIFLERSYSLNGSCFIIERVVSQILASLPYISFLDNDMPWLIHPEFLELHLYIVLLFDIVEKIRIAENKNIFIKDS